MPLGIGCAAVRRQPPRFGRHSLAVGLEATS
jgi:hypothetical protein